MICISLLLCGARCACPDERPISRSTRFTTTAADCYKIYDCDFIDVFAPGTGDKSGGAIKLDNEQAKARILDCLFVSCYAKVWGLTNMGGAIFTKATTTILERCCSDDCFCDELGNFLFHKQGETTLSQVSIINSRHDKDNEDQNGAIYTHAGTMTGTNVNFTANWANEGSALGSEKQTNKLEFAYVTAFGNAGRTVIWHHAGWGKLSFWNFVNNPTIATTVYIDENSLEVENSLFRNNTNGEEKGKDFSQRGAQTVTVHNCIFDGQQIPGFIKTYGNTNDAETRTIKMCQLNFQNCKARVPCDFTQAFTVSSDFVSSQEFTDSERFTQTHDFSESSRFGETPGFSQSLAFEESDSFNASCAFVPSLDFTVSGTFTFSSITMTDQLTSTDASEKSSTRSIDSHTISTGAIEASTTHQSSQMKVDIHTTSKASNGASTTDSAGKSGSKSLSVGAIVGIVVAIIALIVVAIIVIVVVKRRKPSESNTDMDTNDNETNTSTELEQENVTDTQWDPMTEVNPVFADVVDALSEELFGPNAE